MEGKTAYSFFYGITIMKLLNWYIVVLAYINHGYAKMYITSVTDRI